MDFRERRNYWKRELPASAGYQFVADDAAKVFISYAHTDRKFCNYLQKLLNSWYVTYWVDDEQLIAGAHLPKEIEYALIDTQIYIRLCSQASRNSKWVNLEMEQFKEYAKDGAFRVDLIINKDYYGSFIDPNILYIDATSSNDWQAELRRTLEDAIPFFPYVTSTVGNLLVTTKPISPRLAQSVRIQQMNGVVIMDINGGEHAVPYKQGLRVGDIILSIEDFYVQDYREFIKLYEKYSGQVVKFVLIRKRVIYKGDLLVEDNGTSEDSYQTSTQIRATQKGVQSLKPLLTPSQLQSAKGGTPKKPYSPLSQPLNIWYQIQDSIDNVFQKIDNNVQDFFEQIGNKIRQFWWDLFQ